MDECPTGPTDAADVPQLSGCHRSHSRSTALLCKVHGARREDFMKVVANIDFDGDCREAFTTYASILGGELRGMISHRDMPEMAVGVPEDRLDRIVHAWIDIGD